MPLGDKSDWHKILRIIIQINPEIVSISPQCAVDNKLPSTLRMPIAYKLIVILGELLDSSPISNFEVLHSNIM